MPTTISLVRHGLVHNPTQIFYGRLPRFRLGAEGQKQAQAVMTYFQQKPIAAVFSSPMLRAKQTAKIILAGQPECKLHISKKLIEVHTPFDGRPIAELEANGFDLYTNTDPEFEQPHDVIIRITQFMARMRRDYTNQQVIAVTHGDIITFPILWAHQIPLTVENKQNLIPYGVSDNYPQPASVSQFTFHTDDPAEYPSFTYIRPY